MKKQLKILLAGYGDIASQLTSLLVSAGHQVFGIRRTRACSVSENVKMFYGDLRDSLWLEGVLQEQFDVIVFSVTPDERSDVGYRDSYVAVAKSFVSAVESVACSPELVVWVSSTSVYGQVSGEWVDESSETIAHNFSSQRLLEAETIIKSMGKNYGVLPVVVRFSGIYGPGRTRLLDNIRQGRLVTKEPVAWSNRIHSKDCAGVLAHLIMRYAAGSNLARCYVATDCMPVPLYEVYSWLAGKLNIRKTDQPDSVARSGKRCCNQRLLASGYQFFFPTYREGYEALLSEEYREN